MKDPILPDLGKLKTQIKSLKKQKEKKMALATSIQERNKLMMEIQELEVALKVPSKLKSFAKTFSKGLGISGKTLWKGIQGASRNLDRNAPEFRELSRGMVKKSTPTSPMMEMYTPKASPHYSITPRKMKTRKVKKTKKKTTRKPVRRMKTRTMQKKPQQAWEMP